MTFTTQIASFRSYGQRQYLSQYLRERMDELAHEIENATDRLSDDADYAKRIAQKYTLEPITVHWEKQQNTLEKKTISASDIDPSTAFRSGLLHRQGQSIQQTFVVCKVPCSGALSLFGLAPTRSVSMPKIIVDRDSISFEVFLNEHDSDATKREIEYYITCINQHAANIHEDIQRHNSSLASAVKRLCDMSIQKSNKLAAIIGSLGISIQQAPSQPPVVEPSSPNSDNPVQYYSAAISCGGLDDAVATKLNDFLKLRGVKTWFYKEDGLLGQKLYEMMFDMANDHDRVILLCSESSLSRAGFLNELERVLEREARESGSSILMPIALDDYIFGAKVKAKRHHLAQILAQNIGKINASDLESAETQKQFDMILKSLRKK